MNTAVLLVALTTLSFQKVPIDKVPELRVQHQVVQIVLWIVDSGCSKHMTGDRSLLKNFIEKFMGTVRFGNDNFAAITGYGDYIQGNITICHVYYVEGLGHNLFSVGQFCDGDLEVAFRSKTCYVRNLEGDDLLTGGRESNLYTISISDMAASLPVCLMSKATSTKSWLWHRRLSHLNFGTINDLTRLDLVDGLPKFKYGKDHLCSACERGKSKKASHPLKLVPSDHSKLELLHMDLYGPMRSKDETPEIIKKFIAQAQLNYKAKVCKIHTDNGTEFKNATLKAHYEKLGIMQQFLTARTPQQNGVVERRNRTLVEAARTMLIFSRLPEFLWDEAVASAYFTQNRPIIHTRHNKTPYELLRGRKPNVQFRGTSLTGFPAQSVGSSNAIALDSPYLLVLITGASQSRQHVDTSLIHIESRKPPTKSLFDVGSRRISIVTVNTKEYHSDVLAIITRIMRRTLDNNL
ncbi:retrovirus-related pol polyprotein from transposon TNT 1-94 [Tanacetum coccineum]